MQADEQKSAFVDTLEADIRSGEMHPLKAIQQQVERDKEHPELLAVFDHGSWSGRWPLPEALGRRVRLAALCGQPNSVKLMQPRRLVDQVERDSSA